MSMRGLTATPQRSMLLPVMAHRSLIRACLALAAVAVLVISAPIHAGHGHDASSPSATMHATCAICQMQTPVGTDAAATFAILAPECTAHLAVVEAAACPLAPRGDTDACRAPPRLLAL